MPYLHGRITGQQRERIYILGTRDFGGTALEKVCRRITGLTSFDTCAGIPYSQEDLPGQDANGWGLAACTWNKGRHIFVGQTAQTVVTVPGSTSKTTFMLGARSEDGGATWTDVTVSNFLPSGITSWMCTSVVCDPRGQRLVMTGYPAGAVHAPAVMLFSADGGDTWNVVTLNDGATIPGTGADLRFGNVCYDVRSAAFYVAGWNVDSSPPPGEPGYVAAIWKSDDGITWDVVYEVGTVPDPSYSGQWILPFLLGVGADGHGGLMAYGYLQYVLNTTPQTLEYHRLAFYSTDGASWDRRGGDVIEMGMNAASIAGDGRGNWVTAANGFFGPWVGTGTGSHSVWRTADNGVTWTQSGISTYFGADTIGLFDALDGCVSFACSRRNFYGTIFMWGYPTFIGVAAHVYRSTDGGSAWSSVTVDDFDRPRAIAVG